jgi:hypothetical protein
MRPIEAMMNNLNLQILRFLSDKEEEGSRE